MDDNVGHVLQAIKDEGFGSNTIISFVADAGYHLGEHGIFGKHTNYEEGVRVPWILMNPNEEGQNLENFVYKDPRSETGATKLVPMVSVQTPVELLDLFPTLVEAAGLGAIDECPHKSQNITLCTSGQSRVGVTLNDPDAVAISQYPRPGTGVKDNSSAPKKKDIT